MNKLIPKLQNAWTPLNFIPENSGEIQVNKKHAGHKKSTNSLLTDKVHEGYKGDTYQVETDYMEQHPEIPKEAVRGYFHPEEVKQQYQYSEFAPHYFMGKDGKIDSFRIPTNNGAMSGSDPVGEFYVGAVAMDPLFKGMGYLGKLGLAKAGNKWAQAKLFSDALNENIANTTLLTSKLPLNFGWAPAETIPVVHYSKTPINQFNLFNSNQWGVLAEGLNPFGVWFTNKNMFGVPSYRKPLKAARARQTIQGRPYKYEGELELKKPMITVGDVPDRSALEYYAEKAGSDGIRFSDVYDNGMDATESIKSFVHPVNGNTTLRGRVMYFGPTMGKTTFIKSNPQNSIYVDADDYMKKLLKPIKLNIANKLKVNIHDPKVTSTDEYQVAYLNAVNKFVNENPQKILLTSSKVVANPENKVNVIGEKYIPDRETFINRNLQRGFHETPLQLNIWYDLFEPWIKSKDLKINNNYVSDILNTSNLHNPINSNIGFDNLSKTVSNPLEIYKNRVIAKGGEYQTYPIFNLSSEKSREKVANNIIKKFGLDEGESYEDRIKSILAQLKENGLDKIESAGQAKPIEDYEFIHINPKKFNEKYKNADIRMLISHELDHMLHTPKEGVKNFIKSLTNQEYFTLDNGKEVAARVAQVLTNSGVSDARKFTGAEYKQMFEDYIHSNLMLNDMRSLYHSITDWEKFAKWANNPKNVFSTSVLGGTSLLTTNKISK